ncbi:uncharacterized protein BBA_07455 [Beauveria bassiana ARSEF 2860]|uniref:Uncharacterized protein n=1 Tax=Beauveria bassiana (strain ARSEF 2860) TaxID=655819 RepID=J4KM88_BEAB2|nr:uncharacterized protein BBA_07455 [Beauveria bassiana ARSEF 2860]EJP63529.1 hypothetical protein BBA_07455 [Beauveria bassiana ARSEF 2860]
MAESTEERGVIYHIASPAPRKRMLTRPSIIWQLQGFDQTGSLQETLNFHSVSIWVSLISREVCRLRKTGRGSPAVILTRDSMTAEDEAASTIVQEVLSGVVAAGSYYNRPGSCYRLFGWVWTRHMDCRIMKRGEELFEMLVNDHITMHLQVAGGVRSVP